MSLQEQLHLQQLGPLRSALILIQSHLDDLQVARNIEHELTIPNPFPFYDFKIDQHRKLVFRPLHFLTIKVDFLSFVAYHDDSRMLEALLTFSFREETCNPVVLSPLCLSLLKGSLDAATFLLSRDPDPHRESYMTALHAAAGRGDQHMVINFITNFKIPVDSTDFLGATPAIYALYLAEQEAIAMIDLLFQHGASPTMTFRDNATTYACYAAAMDKPKLAYWLESGERMPFHHGGM